MTYAYFPGCKIPYYVSQHDDATRAVLGRVGVQLKEIEFNCCGYPMRDKNGIAYLYSATRNLALAQQDGLDILTPCKCCFGSLKKAAEFMSMPIKAAAEVRKLLAAEGLEYHDGGTKVRHLMQVLDQDLEKDALKKAVSRPLTGLNVAVHYGCHALRPAKTTDFDDPASPTIFERLLSATGAKAADYPQRLECCGNPLWDKNRELSLALMDRKLAGARESGASLIACACNYCQIQLDEVQHQMSGRWDFTLPAVLLPQLIGLSLGCSPQEVGLGKNRLEPGELKSFY